MVEKEAKLKWKREEAEGKEKKKRLLDELLFGSIVSSSERARGRILFLIIEREEFLFI